MESGRRRREGAGAEGQGQGQEPAPNEDLNQIVIQRLSDLHLDPQELVQNPRFAKLLLLLTTERMDSTGLSGTLSSELEKARRELRRAKQEWLSARLMQRVLNEILTDYHIGRWENRISPEDQQFSETLERCLVLGQCCRRLDSRETEKEDSWIPLLGLKQEHIQELQPESRCLHAMKQWLVPLVERRLRDRCFSVLCYYRPEYEGNSEVLKMAKCGAMPELLEAEKQKQERERERNWENQITITKQTITYLTVLHHCFGMLRELIERHRLGSQPEIDAELLAYLRLKTKAMFSKLGLMKLELRHQLFHKDTVQAHTAIRALLQEELEIQQRSVEALRGTLGLYQMLGEGFEGLVSEYSRLLELLGNKRWALQEFTKSQD